MLIIMRLWWPLNKIVLLNINVYNTFVQVI